MNIEDPKQKTDEHADMSFKFLALTHLVGFLFCMEHLKPKIWAVPCKNKSLSMFGELTILRSACDYVESDQGLHYPCQTHWILQNVSMEKGLDETLCMCRMV